MLFLCGERRKILIVKAWRNGSVFDSRSTGWGFKSLCLQAF